MGPPGVHGRKTFVSVYTFADLKKLIDFAREDVEKSCISISNKKME
jgi:hypothetical protein